MKRTTKMLGNKAPVTVMRRDDETGQSNYFASQDELLLPMLELIDTGKQTIALGDERGGARGCRVAAQTIGAPDRGAEAPGPTHRRVCWLVRSGDSAV
jgi:hypothetical protein